MAEQVTVVQLRNASGGILTDAEFEGFIKAVKESASLKGKPEGMIHTAMLEALTRHREAQKMLDGESFPFKAEFVEKSYKDLFGAAATTSASGRSATHAENVVNEFRHMAGHTEPVVKGNRSNLLNDLTHEQKMNAGMAFLMAGLSALGTWSSARGMKTTDEQGTTHWSPTAVGFTLLQGALAAGMAYAGVFALRGAPVGRA